MHLLISIQLLNDYRYCAFVLYHIDDIRDIGNRSAKEPDGGYEYKAKDRAVMPVESEVHHLYNNSTVNHYSYNIFVPAEHPNVEGIFTSLRGQPDSGKQFDKEDVKAVKAYSSPELEPEKVEVLDETITKWLAPKSSNYGQVKGKWKFTMVGTKRTIEARISDQQFLTHCANGEVRFYQGDRIKVPLRQRQIIEGSKSKMEYDIVEVLEYNPQQAVPGM